MLKLRADQEDLVAPVSWSLADAYTMPDLAWPRLVYDGDQLVGFIMAAFAPEHENPLFQSYLWRLNIGADYQGKGYGRFAVEELCREAIRRGHHRLTGRDYLRTRNRSKVTPSTCLLLTGSRSIRSRPGPEKPMPSPSSTGRTCTTISSTSPRRRHCAATSAPRI